MATVGIPQLPSAIGLTGAEQIEIVQAGTSARTTISQIAALSGGGGSGGGGFPAGYIAFASPSGTSNNVSPSGFYSTIGRIDVTLSAGPATWTGLEAGADNQAIILRNADANNSLTLDIANNGSFAINQFAGSGSATVLSPGAAIVMLYYAQGVNNWVLVP
jgi:hypothetical protein